MLMGIFRISDEWVLLQLNNEFDGVKIIRTLAIDTFLSMQQI